MPAKVYDVLIVGSGHSGGMAANILTKEGIECLMLNAGPEPEFEHRAKVGDHVVGQDADARQAKENAQREEGHAARQEDGQAQPPLDPAAPITAPE